MGSPWPMSYMPASDSLYSDTMTMFQRLRSFVLNIISGVGVRAIYGTSCFDSAVQKFTKEKFDLLKIRRNAALMLVDYPRELDFPQPSLSKIMYLGGIECKKEWRDITKISEDLNTKIFEAKKGVILVSVGHHLRWADAPSAYVAAFVEALNRFTEYVVIWQIDIDRPAGLKNHVITMDWVPQAQILHHQKTSLFVSHGGVHSIKEAICAQVPVVGIPFFGDHFGNWMRMKAKEAAHILPKSELGNPDSIYEAMMEVLSTNKYSAGIKSLKRILDQDPIDPLERAVFWSEHVIRNNGADEISTKPLEDLSVIAYYGIDYWAALIFALLFTLKFAKGFSCCLIGMVTPTKKEGKLKAQ